MPIVSVIMTVFNGETYLAESIESILAQTLSDFEFLIVDDGSRDRTAEVIRSYQDSDSRIQFFQLERNMGIADARNRGIAEAQGEYITFMDCDDVSLPQRLQKQVAFLQSNPDIDVIGISGQAVDEDLVPLYDFDLPLRHCLIVFDMFVRVGLIFSAHMMRRKSLIAAGSYEAGRRTSEERELAWRLLRDRQMKFANLPDHLLLYRQHDRSMNSNRSVALQAERDEIRERMLRQLWGEAPAASVKRFKHLRMHKNLGWSERRAAKTDMRRLIDALIAQNLIDSHDRPLLLAATDHRLDSASPRLWQMFRHWLRRHFNHRSARSDAHKLNASNQ